MKILVTGCCGFIGSHLCEALLQLKDNKLYDSIQILGEFASSNFLCLGLVKP